MDITHQVKPYCASQGAFFIAQSYRYFPAGTVHLVVVDPGVGSKRCPIAVKAGCHYFVAPDNGVLSQVFEREAKFCGRKIDPARWGLNPLSHTFHGRDLFAPASAWLARGTPLIEMGPATDDLIKLPATEAVEVERGHWQGRILNIDRFGNIVTSFEPKLLNGGKFQLAAGKLEVGQLQQTYAESPASEPFVMEGSAGYLEVSINRHSAPRRGRRCVLAGVLNCVSKTESLIGPKSRKA